MKRFLQGWARVAVIWLLGWCTCQSAFAQTATITNWASASSGGAASASSTLNANYPASSLNDGDRKGVNWGNGGGWNDGTLSVSGSGFPDYATITFASAHAINEVTIYNVQDNYASPVEPTETMTFSQYGLTSYEVQYLTGSSTWTTIATVTGNNLVKRTVSFAAVTTTAIRIKCNDSADHSYSRLVEIEAWGTTNVGAATAGGLPSVSSTANATGFPAAAINDGVRNSATWGNGGGWNDGTINNFANDWAQIDLAGTKQINSVTVWTLGDNIGSNTDPTDSQTFSAYGLTAFDVQIWNLSTFTWTTVASVTGNNLVKRPVTFPAVTTSAVRVVGRASADNQYTRIVEIEVWGVGADANVALSSAGGVASSSPYYAGFPPTATNDGDRKGTNWGNGGGWNDSTPGDFTNDYVQIDFNGSKVLDSVVVFTLQDAYQSPIEPYESQTFSQYGLTKFLVQAYNGSWTTVATITSDTSVKRTIAFATPVVASKIKIVCQGSADNVSSRITEIQAWGAANTAPPDAPPTISVPTTATGSVTVSWTLAGSGTVPSYVTLDRSTTPSGGTWTSINAHYTPASLGGSGSFTDNTVSGGNTYYYRVAACSTACGGYAVSSGVQVTTPAVTLPPLGSIQTNTIPGHDATVGTMAGQAGTDGGAAQYQIPIAAPPGRAGMQPNVSLGYNSRSGNGVMGMGWTISGLSSIHRCPSTPEQDAQTVGVNYSSNDKLCLDGQRLVAVSGSYGADGTKYRTEVDSYARITQVGALTGTATCFKVEQKDGHILHYGAVVSTTPTTSCNTTTANSRVNPTGATATLSWLVEKIEDRVGNNQFYTYADYTNGEVLISTIAYTGFGTAAGDRSVSFAYTSRSGLNAKDVSSSYLAGGLTMQTQTLSSITSAVGTTTVRTYAPTYTISSYSGRLFMTSMQECVPVGAQNTCHDATTFTYAEDDINTGTNFPLSQIQTGLSLASASDQTTTTPRTVHTIGDLDGDGTREVAISETDASGVHKYLAQFGPNRTIGSTVDLSNTAFDISPTSYVDIDGDGRAELIEYGGSTLSFGVWKLARGATIPASSTFNYLFTTVSSNIPGSTEQPFTGDFDGDGRIDIAVVITDAVNCPNNTSHRGLFIYLNRISGVLSSANTATFVSAKTNASGDAPVQCLADAANTLQKIDHISDFDGNGLPDIFLRAEVLGLGIPSSTHFDGVLLTTVSGGSVSLALQSCTAMGLTDSTISAVNNDTNDCYWSYQIPPSNLTGSSVLAQFIDVNGDGLEDWVIARPAQTGGATWRVRLNQGNGKFGSEIDTRSSAGLDVVGANYKSSQFRYAGRIPNLDVDGDGKPDILIPQTGASAFAVKVCQTVTFQWSGTEGCPPTNPTQAGSEPTPSPSASSYTCAAYACPEDPGSNTVNLPAETGQIQGFNYYWNTLGAYGLYTGYSGPAPVPNATLFDNSVYHLSMLKFVQIASGTIQVQTTNVPLISRLTSLQAKDVGNADDLYGDGLQDLMFTIGCDNRDIVYGPYAANSVKQCAVVADGTHGPNTAFVGSTKPCDNSTGMNCYFDSHADLYVNTNQGATSTTSMVLPALMSSATNGLGDVATWYYTPLSAAATLIQDNANGNGFPIYQIGGTATDNRHYYFTSSMPIVFAMAQSDGVGGVAGNRTAVYGYQDAMYNHLGRGFQGFGVITAEHGVTTGGVKDKKRILTTTTTFNQKFPLVGKVQSVVTKTGPSNTLGVHTVHTEGYSYQCSTLSNATETALADCPIGDALTSGYANGTGTTVFQPVVTSATTYDYDLSGGSASHSVTTNTWDGTAGSPTGCGNLTSQTVKRYDDATTKFVALHQTDTTNDYSCDLTAWWLGELNNTSVASSITYDSSHTLPTNASAGSKTVTTAYTWNTDRTPATSSVQWGTTNEQSKTTYIYPTNPQTSYGLPTKISVNAPDLATALSPTRATSYTYTKDGTTASSDGYFVLTTTKDPSGVALTTTTTHQTADGQVVTATDPNGIQTVTTYDVFGRATKIRHLDNTTNHLPIDSDIKVAYTRCSGGLGDCAPLFGEDSNEAYSVFRVTTVKDGYPTQVAWYDLLGREVKHAERGYSGGFIGALTQYDGLGTVIKKGIPYLQSAGSSYTTWTYDALNRPLTKIAPASEMDTTHGDFETEYSYSGLTTSIKAHCTSASTDCTSAGTKNLWVSMSRSNNVLGQLMQTVDANSKTTNYWTEPQGHVAAITDADSNTIKATYNELGQRTASNDPDQGAWSFSYDAFGELLSQTDARGAVTTITARDGLGRTKTQQQLPGTSSQMPLAETLQDSWTYDPANGNGELGSVTRRRGYGTPGSNTITWSESYTYEANSARPSTTTTNVPDGGISSWQSSVTYDAYGRPSTHTYPSNLTVETQYAPYGHAGAIANHSTGTIYWEISSQDAWNKITADQYLDGTNGTYANYASTGQAQTMSWTRSSAVEDSLTYGYDSFGNLTSQQRHAASASNTETYGYDALQRLTSATRSIGTAVSYSYTASGNISAKSDNGGSTYVYGEATSGCGPHAVSTANGQTYTCDKNGNVTGGSTLSTIWYDANNHPRSITRSGGGTMGWAYDTNGKPSYEQDGNISRVYGPGGYELANGVSRHELGPVIVTCRGAGGICGQASDTVVVALRDRLGSTIDTTDGSSNTRAYDAFGKVRNGDLTDKAGGTLNLGDTIHGFTKHEHADSVQLIHMGGRIYDYQLGRFLQVDPIIQNPANSQGLNPYSYIGNNPLSGVDPTGYAACGPEIHDKEVCTVEKKETVTPTGSHIAQTTTTTWTIAQNGATTYATPNSGKGAFQSLENAINGAGAKTADGPTMAGVPQKVEETSANGATCAKAGTGCEATQRLVDKYQPNAAASYVGNMVGAFQSADDMGNHTNPFTGELIENPRAEKISAGIWGLSAVGPLARGVGLFADAIGVTTGAAETTTVIGRVKDLQNLGPGEKSLLDRLPNQGSPKANWKQNAGVLREEMRRGLPIRDASPGDTGGQFLNAERNLLRDRGWSFDANTNVWSSTKQ